MKGKVVLLPNQIAWSQRIAEILEVCPVYMDISKTGAGKTLMAISVAQTRRLRILVVTTLTAATTWQLAASKYSFDLIDVISYEKLAGMVYRDLKHPYLTRQDYDITGSSVKKYHCTPFYLQLVKKGILLVIDEADAVKNATARNRACCALIAPIAEIDGPSRFALLSATAIVTSGEHVFNIFRLLGVTKQEKLLKIERNGTLKFLAFRDILEECAQIDPQTTNSIMKSNPITKSNGEYLCKLLFTEVICPLIAGAAEESVSSRKNGFSCHYINYYCRVTLAKELEEAADELSITVEYNPTTGRIAKNYNLGILQRVLERIEKAKVIDFARLAIAQLKSDPRCKVVLSMNFLSSVDYLAKRLASYSPLVMTGKTKERREIIDSFNTDPECRVFIFTTRTGGTSISLHDTIGDSPRHMLISPSYSLVDIVQASGRVFREGSKSNATVRIVYGKIRANREMLMIRALTRKSEVLDGIFEVTAGSNVILPKDYEEVEE